jgi:PRC-barrel domain
METAEPHLRYISASRVETPAGSLDQLDVLNQEESNVGKLEGIVVDPGERRVRYFVVRSQRQFRSRHYLVPLAPTTVDAEHRTLHVDVEPDDVSELVDGPAQTFPTFSDADLITALFSQRTH